MPVDPLRLHPVTSGSRRGEFVLYWMQGTMRAHHNFALEHAIDEADARGLPVLVYQGLRHDYPWASDRHHTFILESVADLYPTFEARGIQYAFWLGERAPGPGERSPLVTLADRAALVVTDYIPTFIHPKQTTGLARRTGTPLVAVDNAAIVPIRHHSRAHSTAASIRPALMNALDHQLAALPSERSPRVNRPIELPFTPTVPTTANIPALVARCEIDHTVPPAPAIRGGTTAGRARLLRFLEHGLSRYAAQRGDPNADATSELSPYLHFGCVSPHEVVSAVRLEGGENAAKFIDEIVTWRELALNFCHHDPRHHTPDAIPPWARAELDKHQGDPRPALFDRETLAQARTGEPLWDACQRQYLRDGFMHNYLRMLWGKAVIAWSPDAATAFDHLVDLNNRYSLDGRDASSYASIHWIFGKFDRPFYRRPIYGTVRYMSLRTAKDKFDVPALLRRYGPQERLL